MNNISVNSKVHGLIWWACKNLGQWVNFIGIARPTSYPGFFLWPMEKALVGAADAISNILGDNNFIFLGGEVK